jgi:hypothetical protein
MSHIKNYSLVVLHLFLCNVCKNKSIYNTMTSCFYVPGVGQVLHHENVEVPWPHPEKFQAGRVLGSFPVSSTAPSRGSVRNGSIVRTYIDTV